MILRHDLELVFLHIPKCAGQSLRRWFKLGSNDSNCSELWNYAYSRKLHRYVDLAHLPADDLVHFKNYRQLRRYTTVAVCRHPYLRLASAIKEFHRQRSKEDEQRVKAGALTREDQLNYLRALPLHLAMLDPRYVHALPMRRFSHYGKRCLVDRWLRCEQLQDDWRALVQERELPAAWLEGAGGQLQETDPLQRECLGPAADAVIAVANRLYADDFRSFNYQPWPETEPLPRDCADLLAAWEHRATPSHAPTWIHQSQSLTWHWGPRCERKTASSD